MAGCGTPPAALLPYVKAQLGVTWQDSATDERYTQLIADAMAYFDGKLGSPGDYTPPALREMVKEYVRYARDAALDVFGGGLCREPGRRRIGRITRSARCSTTGW